MMTISVLMLLGLEIAGIGIGIIAGTFLRQKSSLQHQNLQQLNEQLRRQSFILSSIQDAVVVVDRDTRITDWNPGAERLFGYTPNEVTGKLFREVVRVDMTAEQRVDATRKSEERGLWTGEVVEHNKAGDTLTVTVTAYPLRDKTGVTTGFVGILRDASEAREAQRLQLRLAAIVQGSTDAIVSKDLYGIVTSWNPAAEALYGYSAEEMIGHSINRIVPSDRAGEVNDVINRIRRGERISRYETQRIRSDGTIIDVSITVSPIYEIDGSSVGASVITHDITRRKKTEQNLRTSEANIRAVVESSFDSFIFMDKEGIIQDFNRIANERSRLVYGRDIQAGEPLRNFVSFEDDDSFRVHLRDAVHGQRIILEKQFTQVNGQSVWYQITYSPVKEPNETVIGVCFVATDITEHKRFAAHLKAVNQELETRVQERTLELERERTLLRTILDGISEGVLSTRDSRINYINPALAELHGSRAEDLVGHDERDLTLIMNDYTSEPAVLSEAVALGKPWRGKATLRKRNGQTIPISFTASRLNASDVVTLIRDITLETKIEEQKTRFLADASHELRTPLASMKLRLFVLANHVEDRERHLQVLNNTVDHMTRLVEELLDLTRFEQGRFELDLKPVRVQDVVTSAVEIAQPIMTERHIHIVQKEAAGDLIARLDRVRVTQVLLNLITNAINYSVSGSEIFIRVSRRESDNVVLIEVEDQGAGIAPHHLDEIFMPFFRVNHHATVKGTGLGLSIAREIIRLHGGELTVSSALGKGSTFTIRLPISAPKTA